MADQVLPALVNRRRELAGELEKAQALVAQLHADLASLDAVIRQFDPDYNVGAIRPKYRRQASPAEFGAMSRTVLETLRKAGQPLAAKAIASLIMAERGLNTADRGLVRSMNKRVDMALRYQRTNGITREVEGPGQFVLWEVAQ